MTTYPVTPVFVKTSRSGALTQNRPARNILRAWEMVQETLTWQIVIFPTSQRCPTQLA